MNYTRRPRSVGVQSILESLLFEYTYHIHQIAWLLIHLHTSRVTDYIPPNISYDNTLNVKKLLKGLIPVQEQIYTNI
jgi:hypothetical protein